MNYINYYLLFLYILYKTIFNNNKNIFEDKYANLYSISRYAVIAVCCNINGINLVEIKIYIFHTHELTRADSTDTCHDM